MFWRRIPLRLIRAVVDEALDVLSVEFEGLYARVGRPSVRPEELISALLLQGFFSIRSECELMEHLDYNLIFPGYVGLAVDASVWDATRSPKDRDRLLDAELPRKLLSAVLSQPRVAALMLDDHFPVDGTLQCVSSASASIPAVGIPRPSMANYGDCGIRASRPLRASTGGTAPNPSRVRRRWMHW